MAINKEVLTILEAEAFKNILNSDIIDIAQLNAATALLIKANIDFDIIFLSGTPRRSPEAVLTININPCINIDFTFIFGPCENVQ